MRRISTALPLYLVLIVFAMAHAREAVAFTLLGADFSGGLYDIDPSTGNAFNTRDTGVWPLSGIALGPGGLLYGLTTASGTAPNSLFAIDPTTGASQLVGATGLSALFEGDLDFDPTTGLLYGIQDAPNGGAPPRSLFILDTDTGDASVIGSISGGDHSAMAFDSGGNLWVLNTFQEQLLCVDKTNGDTLESISLSAALGAVAGMDFHPVTGALYVADGLTDGTDMLFTLDTGSGVLSSVGPTGLEEGLSGLEFIPEPGGTLLLILGALAAFHRRA